MTRYSKTDIGNRTDKPSGEKHLGKTDVPSSFVLPSPLTQKAKMPAMPYNEGVS